MISEQDAFNEKRDVLLEKQVWSLSGLQECSLETISSCNRN